MANPLVTICVPTYNRAELLKESLGTIRAQNYTPLDVLISDNCSDDDTEKLCRQIAGADPRVRYVRQPRNIGMHANHNFCIEASRGEFLCFFHDDDQYEPDIVGRYVEFMQAHLTVGIVCSDWDLIDEDGQLIGVRTFDVESVMSGQEYIHRTIRSGRSCVGCSGAMVRRSALADIRFNETGPIGFEDFVVWFRIAEAADIGHIHQRLWRYRLHRGSLSRGTVLRMAQHYRNSLFRYCDGYLTRWPQHASLVANWKIRINRYLFWALLYEAGLYFRKGHSRVAGRSSWKTVFELTDYRPAAREFPEVVEALRTHKNGFVQQTIFLLLRVLLYTKFTWPIGWASQYSFVFRSYPEMNGFRRKEVLKKSLYYACGGLTHLSGIGKLRALPAMRGSLRVLMYHKVNNQRGNSLSVPVSLFDEQMAYLKAHYRVISAGELLAHLAASDPLPPRSVLITFDDGYRDVFVNAYPILKHYGHPAVLFVSTNFIRGDRPFPHDRQFARFDNPVLNWEEVRALADLFEIGSHAQSHHPLSRLPPDEARREIVESKAIIEERLGRPVRLFSYPKGGILDFNRQISEWVIEAGYQLCFTTIPKTNRPPLDPFALGRYNVEPYGNFYFTRLLEGSCDLMGLTATRWGAVLKHVLVHQMGAATD